MQFPRDGEVGLGQYVTNQNRPFLCHTLSKIYKKKKRSFLELPDRPKGPEMNLNV